MPGLRAISRVASSRGRRPASTVIRSRVKYAPSKLPVRELVRKESRIRPATTGLAFSPMYASLAVIPGRASISLIGRVEAIPGSMPGTLTNASLALIEAR